MRDFTVSATQFIVGTLLTNSAHATVDAAAQTVKFVASITANVASWLIANGVIWSISKTGEAVCYGGQRLFQAVNPNQTTPLMITASPSMHTLCPEDP